MDKGAGERWFFRKSSSRRMAACWRQIMQPGPYLFDRGWIRFLRFVLVVFAPLIDVMAFPRHGLAWETADRCRPGRSSSTRCNANCSSSSAREASFANNDITRHAIRLDRDLGRKSFADAGYAMEELVAGIGVAFRFAPHLTGRASSRFAQTVRRPARSARCLHAGYACRSPLPIRAACRRR